MAGTTLIVAVDSKNGIGLRGDLPWRIPGDLRRFRERTMGGALVMGRTTFDSIGRALPGRSMHVVSGSMPARPGIEVHGTPQEALAAARAFGGETFVAGGSSIYRALVDDCDRIERTVVPGEHVCDAWYDLDESAFSLIGSTMYDDGCVLEVLERITRRRSS